jgi:outer membrane protein OmpA-like peptidoglycan-associated protein
MRKLPLLPLLIILLSGWKITAQNQAFKDAIHAKLNFIDYGILADNDLRLGQGFEFAYARNLAQALNIGIPVRFGSVKLPDASDNSITAGADLQIRLENMKPESKIVPFAFAGAGYVYEKDNSHVQFPFGAGVHFRLGTYAFLNLQAEYRKALVEERDNLQLGIGYVYLLHKSENRPAPQSLSIQDLDKDGIQDSLDLCPALPGPPSAMGCPDADNDGVGDEKDECPEDAGTAQTNGCPDYDGDGVADKTDECPTEFGALMGCPDTDEDGIADKDDKCPNEKGNAGNKGCPDAPDADGDGVPDAEDLCPDSPGSNRGCPDTDGDGIADNEDKCPYEAGTATRMGCPEPKDSDGDGVVDDQDPCPMVAGTDNGCPPTKAPDSDNDGVPDASDPCPKQAGKLNGCPDSDNDGFADKDDMCPEKAGKLNGCPDTDGDGVADKDDMCPNKKGALNGCPDTDGDGVADKDDPCPKQAGNVNGCPDTDGDGVADKDDSCPKQAGIVNGCPDTDGDGIADKDDKCPDQAGVVAKKGCPEEIKPVAEKKIVRDEKPEVTEAREKLASAARAVQFESAKAILKDASYDVLDEVVALMRKNPSYSLSISGYTDDVGDDETNLKLSQDRTKACYDYLIFRGIKAERIRYAGFGEARPIASNNTAEGREMNRRVEFELILE